MYTEFELETKTGPELVEIYNNLPGVSPVKRFTNLPTGIRRILGAQEPEAPQAVSKSQEKRVAIQKKRRGRKKEPRGVYNEPLGPQLRSCRKNSGRGRLLELTLEGATWEQLREALPQWTEDQLHRHLRNQHFYLGHRLTTDENGVIRAFDN